MQLIRFSKGLTFNLDRIDSIETVNLNVDGKYTPEDADYQDGEYELTNDYQYPFCIDVFMGMNAETVYRTSSSEDMLETYERLLEYIADGIRSGSTIIDLSEILKNSQPERYNTDGE